jgi:hypothetical protein
MILDHALAYHDRGWNVFPCLGKKPLVGWQFMQRYRVKREKVVEWFTAYPGASIGIVTGELSGLCVVDVDWLKGADGRKDLAASEETEELMEALPTTYTVRTGSGGFHLYYAYAPMRNSAKLYHKQMDTRGDGGFVVAAPSVHEETGEEYRVIKDLPLAPLPEAFKSRPSGPTGSVAGSGPAAGFATPFALSGGPGGGREATDWLPVVRGASQGSRNVTAAQFAGKLIRSFRGQPEAAYEVLALWNEARNSPPLDHSELRATFENVLKTDSRNNGNASPAPSYGVPSDHG